MVGPVYWRDLIVDSDCKPGIVAVGVEGVAVAGMLECGGVNLGHSSVMLQCTFCDQDGLGDAVEHADTARDIDFAVDGSHDHVVLLVVLSSGC